MREMADSGQSGSEWLAACPDIRSFSLRATTGVPFRKSVELPLACSGDLLPPLKTAHTCAPGLTWLRKPDGPLLE